jgi:23S rRNA (uracil-5-)-methyltransferase RumA
MAHTGYLRHLLVREGQMEGQYLVDLVTSTQIDADFEKELLDEWVSLLTEKYSDGRIVGILHTKNDSQSDAVVDEGTDILYGQNYFYESLLGLKFKVTPFSFFQTNSKGAEVLYSEARDYILSDGEKLGEVFDLYSGTGTIAQVLSPSCVHVTGVEIVEEAVEAAKENAALNGLTNCDFIAGDVFKVLEGLETKPDMIVLDPPRDGVVPKALKKIISYGVDKMIYIACKPSSLARDIPTLEEAGYNVVRMGLVDMFPSTANVEMLCLLTK